MSSKKSGSVADGKVVSLDYTLRNGKGDILDHSESGEPLVYLHGSGNIVPGLEKQLNGKTAGDRFNAVVAPEDGYGKRSGKKAQKVERSNFPDVPIEVGMPFVVEGPDGHDAVIWVTQVEKNYVHVDTNHPLAGETLHFEVEVVAVREATADELSHGHVHGPHGHHH